MKKRKGGYVVVRNRRLFWAAVAVLCSVTVTAIGTSVARTIQLGELKARVTLLEALLKEPISEQDIALLQSRVAALKERKPPAGLDALIAEIQALEATLSVPVIMSPDDVRLVKGKTVAVVGKVSDLRKSDRNLFFALNGLRVVFWNYPLEATAQVKNGDWAAVIGLVDEYQGKPEIVVNDVANILPAR